MGEYFKNLFITTPYLLLFLSSFTGYLFFLSGKFRKYINILPVFIVSSVVTLCYLMSVNFWALEKTAYFLFFFGQFLLLITFIKYMRASSFARKRMVLAVCNPVNLLFIFLTMVYWFVLYNSVVRGWDEFSHWGRASKEIFLRNNLITADTLLAFKDYPPATQIFHYFVNKNLYSSFHEGMTFYAQFFMFLSASFTVLPTVKRNILSLKKVFKFVFSKLFFATVSALYVLFVCGGGLFRSGLLSLYVDTLLAFYFMSVLVIYFRYADKKINACLFIIPVLAALTLIKASGYFFATVSVVVIFSFSFFKAFSFLKSKSYEKKYSSNTVVAALIFCCLICTPYTIKKSWKNYLIKNDIPVRSSSISVKDSFPLIKTVFAKDLSDENQQVISLYLKALLYQRKMLPNSFKKNISIGSKIELALFPVSFWVLLIAFMLFLIIKNKSAKRKYKYIALFALLTFFLVFYCLGLLQIYLFNFSSFEALRLNSYERYLFAYLFGFFFLFYALLIKYKKYTPVVIISVFLAFMHPMKYRLIVPFLKPAEVKRQRLNAVLRNQVDFIKKKTNHSPDISIIYQGSKGFEPLVIAYELNSTISKHGAWFSLGKPYNTGDIWSNNYTPKEVADLYKKNNFEYVFLARADERFYNDYSELFPKPLDKECFLWKITYNARGEMALIPIKSTH